MDKEVVPGRIGIGITTKNRHALLERALREHRTYAPREAFYFVVDDGSEIPVIEAISTDVTNEKFRGSEIHFKTRRASKGIARSKNDCIEHLLHKRGCEHIFLWDDDAWPVANEWWKPYVDSPQPHLQASFPWPTNEVQTPLVELYRGDGLVAYHSSRGYMLYFHSSVFPVVGGMDERFRYGYEHIDLSNRIYRAGLSLFPSQDVLDSDKLIHAVDSESMQIASSIEPDARRAAWQDNIVLMHMSRDIYQPYRTPLDCVLTCYFTGITDPQRDTVWECDPVEIIPLTASLDRNKVKNYFIFHNELKDVSSHYIPTSCSVSPYVQRWISYRDFLIQNPQIRWVWCVDIADVEVLREPFEHMLHNTVYCGWENALVGNEWMRSHTSDPEWIEKNKNRTLLNAGVLGGDRNTVLRICASIIDLYTEALKGCRTDDLGDMLYFNKAIYESGISIVTGPAVTTVYKSYSREGPAIFRHK